MPSSPAVGAPWRRHPNQARAREEVWRPALRDLHVVLHGALSSMAVAWWYADDSLLAWCVIVR